MENFDEFGIEEGEYGGRFAEVENDLGLNLLADNGDIHQRYLEEISQIICPKPFCKWLPFCKKYVIDTGLNIPITIKGNIKYENPTICNARTNECLILPVKNNLVYIAVRAYVWMKGYLCYGFPEGQSIITVKTIIYPFYTNEEGKIEGTIYAAPPLDNNIPYIEYVDTRSKRIDTLWMWNGNNFNSSIYFYEYWAYGIKSPNSVAYPSICIKYGTEVPCFEQAFDPVNLILNLDVVYQETYEPRTFFLNWDDKLEKVKTKWDSWNVGDTCLPLRAGWVYNWEDKCVENSNLGCKSSWGLFPKGQWTCDIDISNKEGEYPLPAIYIFLANVMTMEIKWGSETPYHEPGHWLYWLMKDKNFEDYPSFREKKCKMGGISIPGTFAEGFAESHLFEFLYKLNTGYGNYEIKAGGEIDSKCEMPIQKDINKDPNPICKQVCNMCNTSISDFCDANYEANCNDTNNSPCFQLIISTQASLLRDIYDNANDLVLYGGKDQVIIPLHQTFNCLKGKVSSVKEILPFIDAVRNNCSIDCYNLKKLVNYFGIEMDCPVLP